MTGGLPLGESSGIVRVLVADGSIQFVDNLNSVVDGIVDRGTGVDVIVDGALLSGNLVLESQNVRVQLFEKIFRQLVQNELRLQRHGVAPRRELRSRDCGRC